MNYYYEIADGVAGFLSDSTYWVQRNADTTRYGSASFSLRAMQHSTRAWSENNGDIRLVKNRVEDLSVTVGACDLEEFLLVKLAAQTL